MDKKLLAAVSLLVLLALNVQWHFDRMCATVFSPQAYFKIDGVYCEVSLPGVEFKLSELLERHERVRRQIECELTHPDDFFMCDPDWIPLGDEVNG